MNNIEEKIIKMLNEQTARNEKFRKDWDRYTTKDVTIFHRVLPQVQKVNNKINHDHVGAIINTKVGHFLGNEIAISFDESNDEGSEKITKFRRYTAFDRVLLELGTQASVFGYGVALAFINDKGHFDFIEIDPWTVFFSKDLVFRTIQEEDDKVIIEAYDKQNKYFYELVGKDIKPLPAYKGTKSGMKHLFNDIPLFKFKNNKEEISETYRVRNIIENVDKMISDLSSEIEQFRLAYLKIVGFELSDEQLAQMISTGAICIPDGNGNADIAFITKNIDIAGVLSAIDLEVKNIFKFGQSYDAYGSREGYGQLTNLGIHFLMAPINNNCKKTILYFKEALYQLFDFYSQTAEGSWLDPLELSFTFTLDTPRNLLEEAQMQQTLMGLVSDETRLKLATFVDDPSKEIQRMEKERNEKDGDYTELEANEGD